MVWLWILLGILGTQALQQGQEKIQQFEKELKFDEVSHSISTTKEAFGTVANQKWNQNKEPFHHQNQKPNLDKPKDELANISFTTQRTFLEADIKRAYARRRIQRSPRRKTKQTTYPNKNQKPDSNIEVHLEFSQRPETATTEKIHASIIDQKNSVVQSELKAAQTHIVNQQNGFEKPQFPFHLSPMQGSQIINQQNGAKPLQSSFIYQGNHHSSNSLPSQQKPIPHQPPKKPKPPVETKFPMFNQGKKPVGTLHGSSKTKKPKTDVINQQNQYSGKPKENNGIGVYFPANSVNRPIYFVMKSIDLGEKGRKKLHPVVMQLSEMAKNGKFQNNQPKTTNQNHSKPSQIKSSKSKQKTNEFTSNKEGFLLQNKGGKQKSGKLTANSKNDQKIVKDNGIQTMSGTFRLSDADMIVGVQLVPRVT